jgi:hypothetical protein
VRAPIEMILVPKHWFADPLNHSMAVMVRPPTALTRRKQLTLEVRVPQQTFFDLVQPLETNDIDGFEWLDAKKSALKPTEVKKSFSLYKYTISKPSQVDKVWRLESQDSKRARPTKKGKTLPFRRGHGSAKLHLSQAEARRGARTCLMSQVTGNVVMQLKVPAEQRVMPTLTIKFAVSTMDEQGNIEWASTYGAKTAAALRKQMQHHLSRMASDPEYPTLDHMHATGGSDAIRVLATAALLPPAPTTASSD